MEPFGDAILLIDSSQGSCELLLTSLTFKVEESLETGVYMLLETSAYLGFGGKLDSRVAFKLVWKLRLRGEIDVCREDKVSI